MGIHHFLSIALVIYLLSMHIVDVQCNTVFWIVLTVEVQLIYGSALSIIRSKIMQKENNRIENPNWQGATSWIITSQEIDLGKTKNKSSKWSEQDMDREQPHCESDVLATGPCIAEMIIDEMLTVKVTFTKK